MSRNVIFVGDVTVLHSVQTAATLTETPGKLPVARFI
jgi:hypothetical protein